jgi:type IV pilus biogenesis protein CpaD/CtpE
MKKLLYALLTVTITVSLVGCASTDTKTGSAKQPALMAQTPTVVVASPMVKLDPKANISIVGAGFTPGQEISIVFTDINGVQANIADYLKPEPKPNESGAWYTTWSCGRYISRKLIKEGAYVITVTDRMYTPLAQAAVAFYQEEEKN